MPTEYSGEINKTLFVINPISGDINKDEQVNQIKKVMKDYNQPIEFYFTTGKNDEVKIEKLIHENNYRKVVAVGGDGTCNTVARVLMHTETAMGILPRGSANGLATELEIPNNIDESLNIISNEKTRKIDVLSLNDEHISLHLSDLGFNARVVQRFEKGNTRGLFGYVKHFFDEVGKAEPATFIIKFENKTKKKKAFMLVVANASKYGTGAVVNPDGSIDDGRFEVIVFRPNSMMQFLKLVVPFFIRQIHHLKFVDVYSVDEVVIKNPDRQTLQIDGEIIGQPAEVRVEIIPQSLKVLVA